MKTFVLDPAKFFDGDQFCALYSLTQKQISVDKGVLSAPDSVPDNPTLEFTKIPTADDKIRAVAITNAIALLEAGNASSAQIQNILAKVLRYIRRENF